MRGYRIRRRANVLEIVGPDGKVHGRGNDLGVTQERCDRLNDKAMKRSRERRRACLRCGTPFLSEGPHNRMCKACRKKADPLGTDQNVSDAVGWR